MAETVLRCRPERRASPAREMGWCWRIMFSMIRRLMSRAVPLRATLKLFRSIFRTILSLLLLLLVQDVNYTKIALLSSKI